MWDHRKARKRIPPSDPSYRMGTDELWYTISELWHSHVSKTQYRQMRTKLCLDELVSLDQRRDLKKIPKRLKRFWGLTIYLYDLY